MEDHDEYYGNEVGTEEYCHCPYCDETTIVRVQRGGGYQPFQHHPWSESEAEPGCEHFVQWDDRREDAVWNQEG